MPLSFASQSHGNIAFGFFNIESDLLLLENYFFFADDFCEWMIEMAESPCEKSSRFEYSGFTIESPVDIGDLMGAIHGIRFSGFIGDVYRKFPFPMQPEAFKQNPNGNQTRAKVLQILGKWAAPTHLIFDFKGDGRIDIGGFGFTKEVFGQLIRYVWQGGYPRWKEEVRPDYVMKMKQAVQDSQSPFFKGVFA